MQEINEKIILINIIGALEAVANHAITIDEAESFIFSPHMIKVLHNKGCSNKILDILEKGCELEDIQSLLPEKLDETISGLKQEAFDLLGKYQQYNENFWLDGLE